MNYLVRYYWYNESNPDEVKITKANVEAKDRSEAYDKSDPSTVTTPAGYHILNWVIIV